MATRELNILIRAKNLASGVIKSVQGDLKGINRNISRGIGQAWKNTERGIVVGAGAAAAGIGYAVKKSIEWEDAFAGVKKTINETDLKKVGTDFAGLAEQFRAMAREMPISATELASIGEAAGALGIRAEDITKFTEVVAKLSVTTDLTSETAGDALGHLGNVLHLTGNDFADLADSLVALGNNGASTESQIIAIAERFGAAGNAAGLTKEEILALASTTASMGIQVEAGGSALSRVFNSVATNIGTSSAKAKAFAGTLSMSAAEFKRAWQRDALGTFQDFLRELNKMDQFDAAATLKKIGITNTRDVNAVRLLASGYKELNKQLDVSRHAAGAMDKEAQQRFNTTKSQLKILKNNLDDAAITIGSALLPKINELVKAATKWIQGHQPEIKKFATDLADGFKSAVDWASKLDWNAIGNTLKTVAGVGKTLLETFLKMPSWVQVAVATGWGLNKFTGGALGGIIGELGKGIIKGVLNMNAAVVNVNGKVVNGPGGLPGGGPGGGGGGLAGFLKGFLVTAIPAAIIAEGVREIAAAGAVNQPLADLGLSQAEIAALKAVAAGPAKPGERRVMIDPKAIETGTAKLTALGYKLVSNGDGTYSLIKTEGSRSAADQKITHDILRRNASEHNKVVTRSWGTASKVITAGITSHAAQDRADSQREQQKLDAVKAAAQRGLAANLRRLADIDSSSRSTANSGRRTADKTAQAVERMAAVEGAARGTTEAINRKNLSVSVNTNVGITNNISVSALSGAIQRQTYTTATGRIGGMIR